MIFGQDRHELRKMYANAWQKHCDKTPLSPLEAQIAQVIEEHPEYHEALGGDLVWFGIVTVIGAEIGLLTPPLGISCFTIKSTIKDPSITLSHIFMGAFPFAAIMLVVLILIVIFPWLSLGLL